MSKKRKCALRDEYTLALHYGGLFGWEEWQTGGGCTAWGYAFEDGSYFLMTIAEDSKAPRNFTDPVEVGFYSADGMEEGTNLKRFPNIKVGVVQATKYALKKEGFSESDINSQIHGYLFAWRNLNRRSPNTGL